MIVFALVFVAVYFLINYYIGRKGWNTLGKLVLPTNKRVYWVFFWLVVFAFPGARFGAKLLPSILENWVSMAGGYWLVAMLYLFLLLLLIDFLKLLDHGLGFIPARIKENSKTAPVMGVLVLVMVFALLAYGTWNARNPIITNYEVTVPKKAGDFKELKVALVSDIHYGEIIDANRLRKMVQMINELEPDIVVMAGDLTEGRVKPEEGRQMTAEFSRIQAKYGTYAVPGNHDRLSGDDPEMLSYFQDAGVAVLRDESIKVADSFYLVGRDDPGHRSERFRKELGELMAEVDTSFPVILLDHQPIDTNRAQKEGADLQLSGHTHRGQLFPNHLITGRIYEMDWGLLKRDNYHLIVSSGFGTWGPPVRIGNNPEVVAIKVKFE